MSAYITPIEEALKELEAKKKRILSQWDAQSICLSLKAKFPEKDIGVSFGWQCGQLNGVLLMIRKVKDLNYISPLFKFLGKHGYLHKGKPEPYEEISRMTWDFGDIKLSAFFDDSDADSCHFKKVGTKTVDDYKFICSDHLN